MIGITGLVILLVWGSIGWGLYVWAAYREDTRRQRFPKQFFMDDEIAYIIRYDGTPQAAPRWELIARANGDIEVVRKRGDE